jgi:hypothetical protein
VQALAQDHADHPRKQRRVLAGAGLEVDMRLLGELAAAWIHDHQLDSTLEGLVQPVRRVDKGNPAQHRDSRVRANEEPGVGVVENLLTTHPASVERRRQ